MTKQEQRNWRDIFSIDEIDWIVVMMFFGFGLILAKMYPDNLSILFCWILGTPITAMICRWLK